MPLNFLQYEVTLDRTHLRYTLSRKPTVEYSYIVNVTQEGNYIRETYSISWEGNNTKDITMTRVL